MKFNQRFTSLTGFCLPVNEKSILILRYNYFLLCLVTCKKFMSRIFITGSADGLGQMTVDILIKAG